MENRYDSDGSIGVLSGFFVLGSPGEVREGLRREYMSVERGVSGWGWW